MRSAGGQVCTLTRTDVGARLAYAIPGDNQTLKFHFPLDGSTAYTTLTAKPGLYAIVTLDRFDASVSDLSVPDWTVSHSPQELADAIAEVSRRRPPPRSPYPPSTLRSSYRPVCWLRVLSYFRRRLVRAPVSPIKPASRRVALPSAANRESQVGDSIGGVRKGSSHFTKFVERLGRHDLDAVGGPLPVGGLLRLALPLDTVSLKFGALEMGEVANGRVASRPRSTQSW